MAEVFSSNRCPGTSHTRTDPSRIEYEYNPHFNSNGCFGPSAHSHELASSHGLCSEQTTPPAQPPTPESHRQAIISTPHSACPHVSHSRKKGTPASFPTALSNSPRMHAPTHWKQ
ncbi:unnamed protein product [Periconia digitata]|uniref:Uncharacterized protein n=1 Tax=Periconia digitata TaxID=1303443 RepID=A0A9W4XJG5_9PLEO|nr:unnamed protein product [Periconia digitata]